MSFFCSIWCSSHCATYNNYRRQPGLLQPEFSLCLFSSSFCHCTVGRHLGAVHQVSYLLAQQGAHSRQTGLFVIIICASENKINKLIFGSFDLNEVYRISTYLPNTDKNQMEMGQFRRSCFSSNNAKPQLDAHAQVSSCVIFQYFGKIFIYTNTLCRRPYD